MANLTVRDPFRSVVRRAFDDPFFRAFSPSWQSDVTPRARRNGTGPATLALDVYEEDGTLHVDAPLPGFDKDDVNVTLEKGKLTIRAEHEESSESADDDSGDETPTGDGRRYFVREHRWGAVSRSLLIGESWDADSVSGSLENGVLKLTIAKAIEAQPRKVEIS